MDRKVGAAIGGLVVLVGVGAFTIPGWLARRAEANEVERVLTAAEAIAVEFEACAVEGAEPSDYGRAITDRLLLDRGYPARFLACNDTRDEAIDALLDSVTVRPVPEAIEDLRAWREGSSSFYNPGRAAICGALEIQRVYRAKALEQLGRTDAAPAAMNCPGYEDYEALSVKPLTPPENSDVLWKVEILLGDLLIAKHWSIINQPARIAAIGLDGGTTVELPTHIEEALLRWGPQGPVAVARPDGTQFEPGTKPYRVERWSDGFQPRPAPRGMGTPEELWLTPNRWFLASIGDDPRKPTDLTIHISDDQGEHFSSLTPPTLPTLPGPRRFRLMGHAEGSELLMLAARATAGADDPESEFQALPAEAQLAVVRIDASGQISSSAMSFEHSATSRWGVELHACPTDAGAMMVIDGKAVVAVEGLEAKLVHRFAAGEELDVDEIALACHQTRAMVFARRRTEPEPIAPITGIDSAGGPLYRFVCDANGCDAGELVTDWAIDWDTRPTEAGVRALVQLHVAPASTVYLIDEPPGGPLETRVELDSYFAPIKGVVWDGTTFAPGIQRGRWGWF